MTAIPPVIFDWSGEVMTPRYPKIADKHYVVGERYALVPYEGRSRASHDHFFACLHDAWQNLPEALVEQFPNEEKLRKTLLIRAGYADSQTFVCRSKVEAQRMAAFIQPIDEFSVIAVNGVTVTRWTAKSQSLRAMGKDTFQASKQAVLDLLAELIGATPAELAKNAGAVA